MKIGIVQLFEMIYIFNRDMESIESGAVRHSAMQDDILVIRV